MRVKKRLMHGAHQCPALFGRGQRPLKNGAIGNATRLDEFRMPLWSMAGNIFGVPHATRISRAITRMSELSVPKVKLNTDLSIGPDFIPSPFPNIFWKNDFLENTRRLQSLRGMPVFGFAGVKHAWKDNFFKVSEKNEVDQPYTDYIHAYWLARKFNILKAND